MQLTVHLPLPRRRPAREAAKRRASHQAPAPARPALPARAARRRPPAPQDNAFYTCECGFAWTAAVTASVGCPHCGATQAW